jgi:RHS repeat-associated protein
MSPTNYIRDHLGSVRAVTDEDGEVVARYDYDPYGKRRLVWHSGEVDPLTYLPIEFDFGFTGHLHHGRSGLYFAPLRAYDPELGRWLSRDPIDMAGGINLCEYVGGDPVNAVDPWGLDVIVVFDKKALHGNGHPAIIVGNETTGYTYLSYSTGRDKTTNLDNLETVTFPDLNRALRWVRDNSGFQYSEMFTVPTTRREDIAVVRTLMFGFGSADYFLAGNNCQDMARLALNTLGWNLNPQVHPQLFWANAKRAAAARGHASSSIPEDEFGPQLPMEFRVVK